MALSRRNKILVGLALAAGALVGAYSVVDAIARQQLGVSVATMASAASNASDSGYLSAFGPSGPDGTGPLFNEAERRAVAAEIGLDAKQQEQVAKLFAGPPPDGVAGAMERLRQARKIVTPEQVRRAQEIIPGKMVARLKERREKARTRLSPEEFAAYDKKFSRLMSDLEKYSRDLRGK